jgi:hypothetical protein
MIVIEDPTGYPLYRPARACELWARVLDRRRLEDVVGRRLFVTPTEPGVPELRITRHGFSPDELHRAWWRRLIRREEGDDWEPEDDGYAEQLACAAERLMTKEEATELQGWMRLMFGSFLVVHRQWSSTLDPMGFDTPDMERSWMLCDCSAYTLGFPAVAEAFWVLPERPRIPPMPRPKPGGVSGQTSRYKP